MRFVIKEKTTDDPNECVDVNEWVNRTNLEQGYTIANAKYKSDCSKLDKLFRSEASKLYAITVTLRITQNAKLFRSVVKQRKFIRSVMAELDNKKVQPIHYKLFDKFIRDCFERIRYVQKIVNENIRLSEFGPFFDIYNDWTEDPDTIAENAQKWNEEHPDIVSEYLERIKEEREAIFNAKRKRHEQSKAERNAEKQKKKEEDAYIKEMINNKKKNDAEYKKIERMFQKYYNGRHY